MAEAVQIERLGRPDERLIVRNAWYGKMILFTIGDTEKEVKPL
jgi:hypothetical protein